MITLADAIVYFKGDSTGLESTVNQMTGRVQTAGDNMRKALNFGALAAGAQVLGSGINALIAEANDSERSFANLEAAVTATGGAAGYTAQQLAAMAGELSGMTAIDDEAIQDGQAMLVTFKNIGQEVFPLATKAMLDMATAMNGGLQPSGEQLKGTAIQLGKALNDPIAGLGALSRVGVQFTDQQKEQIKTMTESGNIMGAQRIILDELSAQFGGAAAARLNTFQGSADALKISMGNLMAEMGKFAQPLTPILTLAPGAATVFNGLKTGVMAAAGAFGFFTASAAPAAAALPAVAGAATAASTATAGMGVAATAAAATIAGPGALVAAAGFAVVALGLMAKAAWDAGRAHSELEAVEATYSQQVKTLVGVLDAKGVAYDKLKMAQMTEAEQIDYLNQLYGKHVQQGAAVYEDIERRMQARSQEAAQIQTTQIMLNDMLSRGEINQEEYTQKTEELAQRRRDAWEQDVQALEKAAAAGDWMAEWIAAGARQQAAQNAASGVGQNASGTDNWRGGLTWVGEQGPELVNLPSGTQIFDAETSRSMMAGGGGISIQGPLISGVSVSGKYDVNQLAADMMDALKMRLNQRGIRAWA